MKGGRPESRAKKAKREDFNKILAWSQAEATAWRRTVIYLTLGLSSSGRLLVVCHTFNEEPDATVTIRSFSARRPTSTEIKIYEGAVSDNVFRYDFDNDVLV